MNDAIPKYVSQAESLAHFFTLRPLTRSLQAAAAARAGQFASQVLVDFIDVSVEPGEVREVGVVEVVGVESDVAWPWLQIIDNVLELCYICWI